MALPDITLFVATVNRWRERGELKLPLAKR